jgi:hypothetical protein
MRFISLDFHKTIGTCRLGRGYVGCITDAMATLGTWGFIILWAVARRAETPAETTKIAVWLSLWAIPAAGPFG